MEKPILYPSRSGFTLIEMSIVLVIIGLLLGGILVGKDLVNAAAVRSQVSQLEQYNSAFNTFRTKYNGLPGDIFAAQAAAFGFTARPNLDFGTQKGNGGIESLFSCASGSAARYISGETTLFWDDLSKSKLIEGSYTGFSGGPSGVMSYVQIRSALPESRIKARNFVLAYCLGDGQNYLEVFAMDAIDATGVPFTLAEVPAGLPAPLTPAQVFSMDVKLDDGLPTNGRAQATVGQMFPGVLQTVPGSGNCTIDDGSGHIVYNLIDAADMSRCGMRVRIQ
jgi:prepilin-type N-terminal cleavage/methylation domain-containing protein